MFTQEDAEIESRSDAVFDSLDDYARCEIVRCGTAFTTYEDLGDDVCRALERRCRAWFAYTAAKQEREAAGKVGK